jgi:hypothetical protein
VTRPTLEVAGIFRQHGPSYRATRRMPLEQLRVMRAIETCRTAALGGHKERCGHCRYERYSYNSCRNRHCPKCQNTARAQWVERRRGELLPVEYFHVVFTIPQELNALALQNARLVYNALFRASALTLETIAADPRHLGARIGFFSVLHTWGQNLLHHPHVHCVVTGGGLSLNGSSWISCRPGFFLSVRVLSRLFRRLFLAALAAAFHADKLRFFGNLEPLADHFPKLLTQLAQREWVVYAKPPFGGPQQVIDYLGRYTHRVAISNNRLENITNSEVEFRYKQYRSRGKQKQHRMRLRPEEFIRRFLMHTLPPGFQRIRHYGLLASRHKADTLALCRHLLDPLRQLLPTAVALPAHREQILASAVRCPVCHIGEMARIEILPRRTGAPYCDSS